MIPRNHEIFKKERDMMSGTMMGLGGMMAPANAQKFVVRSGNWTDPGTWNGGSVPSAGDNIHIPIGKRVTYNQFSDTAYGWIRNDGSFKVATANVMDTRLVCHTHLNTVTSYLEIGTPVVGKHANFDLHFVAGPLLTGDLNADGGKEMSKGLLTQGRVMINGESKIPYAQLPETVLAGSTSVIIPDQYDPWTGTLRFTGAQVVSTWKVGDVLNFPRNAGTTQEDPDRTITAINATTGEVTFTPALANPHSGPGGDPHAVGVGNRRTPDGKIHRHQSYVINETRSITLKSLNGAVVGERAHCMIMHGRIPRNTNKIFNREDHIFTPTIAEMGDNADTGVSVSYIACVDMGRTRTIGSPKIGQSGNQVGRYGIHFHGVGHWSQNPARAKGIHVQGSVGWAFVRHDCNVHVDFCTANGVTATGEASGGALFVDETDTEFGFWTRCLGYATYGTGRDSTKDVANNEISFNGHGHMGDAFAINRQSSVRELIGINVRNLLHLHPPKTNTRNDAASWHTWGFPVDRRPDVEGFKRQSFLPNPIAAMWQDDSNPGGWFACIGLNSGNGLRVFHRQRGHYAMDYHTLVEGWTLTNCGGQQIITENYTHNYIMKGNSFVDGGQMWRYGDKNWGMVWVQNYAEGMSNGVFAENFGPVSETYNIQGGFADNEWAQTFTFDVNYAMDVTNYDSSAWTTVHPFSVTFDRNDYGGITDTIKATIKDGFVGNIPLHNGIDEAVYPAMGDRIMGYGRRGITDRRQDSKIILPGADTDRGYSWTDKELCFVHGTVNRGDNTHYVPLYFPYRNRLTGSLHFARTEYDVSHLDLTYRQKYELPADPGEPDTSKLVPTLLDDYNVTSYSCFPDPDHPIHYVITDGKLVIDSSEADLELPEGQSRTYSRTFTFSGGATQTINFTVNGKAKAPTNLYTLPTITRQGQFHTAVQRGADEFVPTTLDLNKGKADGWPYPWALAEMRLERDGLTGYAVEEGKMAAHSHFFTPGISWSGAGAVGLGKPEGYEDLAPEGKYRMYVKYENPLGFVDVTSNTIQITTQGGFTTGTNWEITPPATVADNEN